MRIPIFFLFLKISIVIIIGNLNVLVYCRVLGGREKMRVEKGKYKDRDSAQEAWRSWRAEEIGATKG